MTSLAAAFSFLFLLCSLLTLMHHVSSPVRASFSFSCLHLAPQAGTTKPPNSPVSPVGEAPALVETGAAEAPDEHCNLVWPGLWVGDLTAATEPARLLAAGITHVVDLGESPWLRFLSFSCSLEGK